MIEWVKITNFETNKSLLTEMNQPMFDDVYIKKIGGLSPSDFRIDSVPERTITIDLEFYGGDAETSRRQLYDFLRQKDTVELVFAFKQLETRCSATVKEIYVDIFKQNVTAQLVFECKDGYFYSLEGEKTVTFVNNLVDDSGYILFEKLTMQDLFQLPTEFLEGEKEAISISTLDAYNTILKCRSNLNTYFILNISYYSDSDDPISLSFTFSLVNPRKKWDMTITEQVGPGDTFSISSIPGNIYAIKNSEQVGATDINKKIESIIFDKEKTQTIIGNPLMYFLPGDNSVTMNCTIANSESITEASYIVAEITYIERFEGM